MANCIGCDTPIPQGGSACPMCGAPVKEKTPGEVTLQPARHKTETRKTSPTMKRIGIALLLLFILSIYYNDKSAQEKKQSPAGIAAAEKEKEHDRRATRALAGAMTLKKAMRNPDSFKVSSALVTNDGSICYEYRAQNGFGGMNVDRVILLQDDTFITKERDDFGERWQAHCSQQGGEDLVAYVDLLLK